MKYNAEEDAPFHVVLEKSACVTRFLQSCSEAGVSVVKRKLLVYWRRVDKDSWLRLLFVAANVSRLKLELA